MIERGRVAGNYPGRCLDDRFPSRGSHQGNRRQSGGRDSRVVAFFLVSDLSLALIFSSGFVPESGFGLVLYESYGQGFNWLHVSSG